MKVFKNQTGSLCWLRCHDHQSDLIETNELSQIILVNERIKNKYINTKSQNLSQNLNLRIYLGVFLHTGSTLLL